MLIFIVAGNFRLWNRISLEYMRHTFVNIQPYIYSCNIHSLIQLDKPEALTILRRDEIF